MPNEAVQYLLTSQRDDGGWGPYPTLPSRTESTALAALALRLAADVEVGARASATSGARWLTETQLDSGAWALGDGVPGPNWSTTLATLALTHFEGEDGAAAAGGAWVLGARGQGPNLWSRALGLFLRPSDTVELDPDLKGWPWVQGTASWVEPTSYALLSLKRLRLVGPAADTRAHIDEAERMLLDRQCDDGGWNYGNSRVFGDVLTSYPDTTSLALLALADRRGEPAVTAALEALPGLAADNDSTLAMGLVAVALATLGGDPEPIRARLRNQLSTWDGGDIRGLAWAAIGLLDGSDPLGLLDG